MSMNQAEVAEARTKATDIVQRAQQDPAFKEQLKDNPVGTLTDAGIPEPAVQDLISELGVSPEVSGYQLSDECWVSCWFTEIDIFQH